MPTNEKLKLGSELNNREAWELTITLGSLALHENDSYLSPYELPYREFLEGLNKPSVDNDSPIKIFKPALERVEKLKSTIEPYLGRLVTGKSHYMVFNEGKNWHELQTEAPFFANGTISGIESHHVRSLRFFSGYSERYKVYSPENPDHWPQNFRTGVVLNLARPAMCNDSFTESHAPNTDTVLVPIFNFPKQLQDFYPVWTDGLASTKE